MARLKPHPTNQNRVPRTKTAPHELKLAPHKSKACVFKIRQASVQWQRNDPKEASNFPMSPSD